MKFKVLISLIFVLVFGAGFATAQTGTDVVAGKRLTVKSKVLGEDREILVSLPETYGNNSYTRYPVLYMLDGRKFFRSFSGAVLQLSSDASPQLPELIVVGISSQRRVRDSSPTHSSIGYTGKEESGYEESGGADNFLTFIETELIPFIDANYRTNSYRTIAGYSFTGLPVLHSLFKHTDVFDSYLVIDFSAWWDKEVTLKNMKEFFARYKGPAKKDVFIATETRVYNVVYPEKINPTWKFIQAFDKQRPPSIGLGYKRYAYKEENHHSMPLISFIEGMKYIFRGHMINYDEMYTITKLNKPRFAKLSGRLGYKIALREDLVDFFGSQFLNAHIDLEKALFYFTYNTENYPLSINAWNSLGDAYRKKGDKVRAASAYEKALSIDPENAGIKQKLDELRK